MPPPTALMDELVGNPFFRLWPDLVEEVFFRLPPDEPACLVRASAVCKLWRRILADLGFRRRYRKFHGAPPVLGFFQQGDGPGIYRTCFVPASALVPAQPDRPGWIAMDSRHGRVLFAHIRKSSDLTVLDPVTGHHRALPSPNFSLNFSAAVLCAAQGCDHHGCQGGHFRVVIVTTNQQESVTLGWLYSSETRVWSKLTSVHHPNVKFTNDFGESSVLVGDALYFNCGRIMECQLGTLRLSMSEKPIDGNGTLMAMEDGQLGFAAVAVEGRDDWKLTLWLRETGPEGAMGWAKLRVIDLNTLLPDAALSISTCEMRVRSSLAISGIAEGTQIIFVRAHVGSYVVDLKSRRVRPAVYASGRKFLPYVSFYIPAMEAACTGQGQ